MPVQRIVPALAKRCGRGLAGFAPLLLVGCSDDPRATSPDTFHNCATCIDGGVAGSSGSSGAGGSGAMGGASPSGGSGGFGPDAGGGVGGESPEPDPVCGNGVAESGEECDGSDFDELSCQSFGFSEGSLACAEDCTAQTEECNGVEECSDGRDNDGDGSVDCADDDCASACVDFCSAPTPLGNATLTPGRIASQQSSTDSSCAASPDESGMVAFSYVPPVTGVASVFLTGSALDLSVSVRTDCTEPTSEQACDQTELGMAELEVPVTEGESVYLLVESVDRSVPASFELVATARPIVCGDGYVDADEECDDGNVSNDDGCSDDCRFQSSEQGPNGGFASADAYLEPAYYGSISDPADRDVVRIEVPQGYMLVAQTSDLGEGSCSRLEMDSFLELFDSEGELVAEDDDAGIGFCAALVAEGLDAGEYFVRVSASGGSSSFLYQLRLSLFAP